MQTITLEDAQVHLVELIARLQPGEEIIITQQQQPVARLVAEQSLSRAPRQPGSAIGQLIIVEEDEEHLKDFQDYMP